MATFRLSNRDSTLPALPCGGGYWITEYEPPPNVATLPVELLTNRDPVAGVQVVVVQSEPTLVQTAEPFAVTSSSALKRPSPPWPRTESADTVAVTLLQSVAR